MSYYLKAVWKVFNRETLETVSHSAYVRECLLDDDFSLSFVDRKKSARLVKATDMRYITPYLCRNALFYISSRMRLEEVLISFRVSFVR